MKQLPGVVQGATPKGDCTCTPKGPAGQGDGMSGPPVDRASTFRELVEPPHKPHG